MYNLVILLYTEVQNSDIRPAEEGGSDYCKLRDSSCFGILRGSILKIGLVIRLKGGLIFWAKIEPKTPILPKIQISRTAGCRKLINFSKWPQDLIYDGCSRYVYYSGNWKCSKNTYFCFMGSFNYEIAWFFVSREPPFV